MALGTMRDAAHSSDGDTLPPALGMYDWQGVRSETGQHFKRHRDGVLNRYRILEAAHYNPKALDLTAIRLPADVVRIQEFVSQNTHEVWARQRIAQGWKWGENRDNRRKLHPDLIPYEELTDECKECVVMMVFPCLVRGASHLLVSGASGMTASCRSKLCACCCAWVSASCPRPTWWKTRCYYGTLARRPRKKGARMCHALSPRNEST